MVQSVSISSVSPAVRSRTHPEASPTAAATTAASARLVIGSFQTPCLAMSPTA